MVVRSNVIEVYNNSVVIVSNKSSAVTVRDMEWISLEFTKDQCTQLITAMIYSAGGNNIRKTQQHVTYSMYSSIGVGIYI